MIIRTGAARLKVREHFMTHIEVRMHLIKHSTRPIRKRKYMAFTRCILSCFPHQNNNSNDNEKASSWVILIIISITQLYRCMPLFNKRSVSNNFIPFGSRSVAYN